MSRPLVSIITATYNASHILRYAIASVLLNEFTDWELIIVGDCCTDDTESVVASFADSRIRYKNLSENSGQQATPNNHGLAMARGDYVCFLNHDDMYLPFHLSSMLEASRNSPDSILLSRYADVRPSIVESQHTEIDDSALQFHNRGPTLAAPQYQPRQWQIASSWFMPMSVAMLGGPWRLEKDTYVSPSQDWLFRAWHKGIPVVGVPQLSMVVVCTGRRSQFFSHRHDAVHKYVFTRYVRNADTNAELLEKMNALEPPRRSVAHRSMRMLYNATICELCCRMGIHPNTPEMIVRHGGPGGFIRAWRKGVNLDE